MSVAERKRRRVHGDHATVLIVAGRSATLDGQGATLHGQGATFHGQAAYAVRIVAGRSAMVGTVAR